MAFVVPAALLFIVGGCGDGPHLEAGEDIRLYESADAALEAGTPVGSLAKGTRVEVVECIYMKSEIALGVRSDRRNTLYVFDGDYALDRLPNCRG